MPIAHIIKQQRSTLLEMNRIETVSDDDHDHNLHSRHKQRARAGFQCLHPVSLVSFHRAFLSLRRLPFCCFRVRSQDVNCKLGFMCFYHEISSLALEINSDWEIKLLFYSEGWLA